MINALSVCVLLSIPMLFIAFTGNNYNLTALEGTSIVVFLTLGNVGESELQNFTIPVNDILSGIQYKSETIKCRKYENDESMHQFEKLRFVGLVNSSVDLGNWAPNKLPNIEFHEEFSQCLVLNELFQDAFYEGCYDDFECFFSFYLRDINTKCLRLLYDIQSQSKNDYSLLLTLQCNRVYTYLGFQLPKDIVGYTWVSLDLGILTILAVYLQFLNFYENKDAKRAKEFIRSAGRYSVQVRNLPDLQTSELYGELFEHFDSLSPYTEVADIGIGVGDQVMDLLMKQYTLKKKMAMNSKKMIFLKQSENEQDKVKMEQMSQDQAKLEQDLDNLTAKIQKLESSGKKPKAVFVTFMSENGANYAIHNYSRFSNRIPLLRWFHRQKIQHF